MLATARLRASLFSGFGPARRWLAVPARHGLPRIGEIKTVAEVLRVQEHAREMRPMDLSACWNTLGSSCAASLCSAPSSLSSSVSLCTIRHDEERAVHVPASSKSVVIGLKKTRLTNEQVRAHVPTCIRKAAPPAPGSGFGSSRLGGRCRCAPRHAS